MTLTTTSTRFSAMSFNDGTLTTLISLQKLTNCAWFCVARLDLPLGVTLANRGNSKQDKLQQRQTYCAISNSNSPLGKASASCSLVSGRLMTSVKTFFKKDKTLVSLMLFS